MSYQHVLAATGQLDVLQRRLDLDGVVPGAFPLLSVLAVVGNAPFIRRNLPALLDDVCCAPGLCTNPAVIAVVLGDRKLVHTLLEQPHAAAAWMRADAQQRLGDHSRTFEFHQLRPLFRGFLEFDNAKQALCSSPRAAASIPAMRSFCLAAQ
eukprot:EST42601.1 Hypothetical protein SS50377_17920 [Spironucleus salmonicida]